MKFLISRVSELLSNILNLTFFASILTYICMCGSGSVFRMRIRIQEAPEYGSNRDPDPQHCLKPFSPVSLTRCVAVSENVVFTLGERRAAGSAGQQPAQAARGRQQDRQGQAQGAHQGAQEELR